MKFHQQFISWKNITLKQLYHWPENATGVRSASNLSFRCYHFTTFFINFKLSYNPSYGTYWEVFFAPESAWNSAFSGINVSPAGRTYHRAICTWNGRTERTHGPAESTLYLLSLTDYVTNTNTYTPWHQERAASLKKLSRSPIILFKMIRIMDHEWENDSQIADHEE